MFVKTPAASGWSIIIKLPKLSNVPIFAIEPNIWITLSFWIVPELAIVPSGRIKKWGLLFSINPLFINSPPICNILPDAKIFKFPSTTSQPLLPILTTSNIVPNSVASTPSGMVQTFRPWSTLKTAPGIPVSHPDSLFTSSTAAYAESKENPIPPRIASNGITKRKLFNIQYENTQYKAVLMIRNN